jgi:hypothetical protein
MIMIVEGDPGTAPPVVPRTSSEKVSSSSGRTSWRITPASEMGIGVASWSWNVTIIVNGV